MTILIRPFFAADPVLWLTQTRKAGPGRPSWRSLFVVGTITVSWLRGFLSQCLTVLVAGFYGFICSAVVAVKWYVMGLFRS